MEKAYWLGRKRATLKLAQNAACSQARLVHYDLAGRYSVKAVSAETLAIDLAELLASCDLRQSAEGHSELRLQ